MIQVSATQSNERQQTMVQNIPPILTETKETKHSDL